MSGNPTIRPSGDKLTAIPKACYEFIQANRTASKANTASKEIRAKGRRHFIFYTGILRWGMSVSAISTLVRWRGKYG